MALPLNNGAYEFEGELSNTWIWGAGYFQNTAQRGVGGVFGKESERVIMP